MVNTSYNFKKLAENFNKKFNISVIAILDRSNETALKEGLINVIYSKGIGDYIESGSSRPKRLKSGELHINFVDILDVSVLLLKNSETAMEYLHGNVVYSLKNDVYDIASEIKELSDKYMNIKDVCLGYLEPAVLRRKDIASIYDDVVRLCYANYIMCYGKFPDSVISSLPAPVVDKNFIGGLHNESFKSFVNSLVRFVILGDYDIADEYPVPDDVSEYMARERLSFLSQVESFEDVKTFTYDNLTNVRNMAYSIIEKAVIINSSKDVVSNGE